MRSIIPTRPYARRMMWAGSALDREFPAAAPGEERVGEALEVSGLESMPSTAILEGVETSFPRFFEEHRQDLLGPVAASAGERRFPLLVKRIDAGQDLSVQVHPDDELARRREGEPNGKSEAWVVLDAVPGAKVWLGFKPGVGEADIDRVWGTAAIRDLLREIPVKAGDALAVPAGAVHAIGAGVLLYEVQQPSNVTYRIFDYDRVDPKTGGKRPLHLEAGRLAIRLGGGHGLAVPRREQPCPGLEVETLVEMETFGIARWRLRGRTRIPAGRLTVLHVAQGAVELEAAGEPTVMAGKGRSVLLPAARREVWVGAKDEAVLLAATTR